MKKSGLILKIDCPDQPGIVAKLASHSSLHGGNLTEFSQFTDSRGGRFFARLEIDTRGLNVDVDDFISGFGTLGRGLEARWHFRKLPYKMRTAVMVTATDHCLNEVIWRTQLGELPIEVTSIIGNRENCRSNAENAGIPFHQIPIEGSEDAKAKGFDRVGDILKDESVELIVLARFMQIIPAGLCEQYSGRIINIHHSFLPAFIGANPYRKAYERGVKLIGATCHYVTGELDAGPIIEQEVKRVQHFHMPNDLVRLGRDCERTALARGIRYHVNDRTIIDSNRAIVFPD